MSTLVSGIPASAFPGAFSSPLKPSLAFRERHWKTFIVHHSIFSLLSPSETMIEIRELCELSLKNQTEIIFINTEEIFSFPEYPSPIEPKALAAFHAENLFLNNLKDHSLFTSIRVGFPFEDILAYLTAYRPSDKLSAASNTYIQPVALSDVFLYLQKNSVPPGIYNAVSLDSASKYEIYAAFLEESSLKPRNFVPFSSDYPKIPLIPNTFPMPAQSWKRALQVFLANSSLLT